ncbi:MAG TPA: metal ABC transporter permease [Actinomycetales bacterium]|nr:metal ABC transporter permease [Actinomycetales bacterium]
MDWLLEPFLLGFQQRALVGGLITALMTSVVGVWLVLRGMTFFGDAFVHAVIPGIAAAIIFDFSPYLGAAAAAVVMVAGIEYIHRSTTLGEDTGIGLLFVGMLALGVVIISKSDSYTGNITTILFGDALGVTRADIYSLIAFAAVVLAGSFILYRPLLVLSFSPQKANALGMRPRLAHALLLALIAIAIIGAFQTVGTMLAFGLLVGPPATAALISRTIPTMFAWSAGISAISVVAGLVTSYHLGTAASATMAFIPVALFFVVLTIVNGLRLARRRVGEPVVPERTTAPAALDPLGPVS